MTTEISLSIITILVTAIGLLFVVKQIADSRRFAKAEFVNQLELDIANLYETYIKLPPNSASVSLVLIIKYVSLKHHPIFILYHRIGIHIKIANCYKGTSETLAPYGC